MTGRASFVAAFGRLLIASIFLFSGVGKVLAPAMTQGYIAAADLPLPWAAYLIAVAVELGGGGLLVLGFQTRLVAGVMAVFCVAAALGFHSDFADQNQLIHFLKNISMAGGLLQVVAFGAGAFSIDGAMARSSTPSASLGCGVAAGNQL
jgi:putative oxidoreductase